MFTFDKDEMYLNNDQGHKIAYVLYPEYQNGVRQIKKVFVDESLRGQGMASKLLDAVYEHFKNNKIKTIVTCPYAVSWFEKHLDKQDIVLSSDEAVACAI